MKVEVNDMTKTLNKLVESFDQLTHFVFDLEHDLDVIIEIAFWVDVELYFKFVAWRHQKNSRVAGHKQTPECATRARCAEKLV